MDHLALQGRIDFAAVEVATVDADRDKVKLMDSRACTRSSPGRACIGAERDTVSAQDLAKVLQTGGQGRSALRTAPGRPVLRERSARRLG